MDRWVKAGKVVRLRRGVYVMQRPYVAEIIHPFAAANALAKASYVSLQSALAHYGMIPEWVPVTTSVTTGRPEELATPAGRFLFRHVARERFFGFHEDEVARDQWALVASPAKALVDLLYLTPRSDDPGYLRELRLEWPDDFDLESLRATAARMGSAKVERAVRLLNAG